MATTTRAPKIATAAVPPSAMTSPAQIERLGEHLRKLRLLKSGERLEALLQHAAAQELPYAEFLEQVLGEEVAAKASKNIAMRTAMARLPCTHSARGQRPPRYTLAHAQAPRHTHDITRLRCPRT